MHLYGFSPVWVLWWELRSPLCLKLFPHSMHLYGFSPVWVLWWELRWLLWLKLFPHSMHLYGFSAVWVLWWETRLLLLLKLFPHCRHLYCLSPLRDVSCELQWLCIVKLFPCSMCSLRFSSGWTLPSLLSSEAPLNVYLPREPFLLPFPCWFFQMIRSASTSIAGEAGDFFFHLVFWLPFFPFPPFKCVNFFCPSYFFSTERTTGFTEFHLSSYSPDGEKQRDERGFLCPKRGARELQTCQLDIHLRENSGGDYKADPLQTSWKLKANRTRLKELGIFSFVKRSLRGET